MEPVVSYLVRIKELWHFFITERSAHIRFLFAIPFLSFTTAVFSQDRLFGTGPLLFILRMLVYIHFGPNPRLVYQVLPSNCNGHGLRKTFLATNVFTIFYFLPNIDNVRRECL